MTGAAARPPKQSISGWIVLDKPAGMTSTQAVGRVRRLFRARKAGHAGTLDPLATGILPIALGEATKTVPFVQDGTKTYRFDIIWGTATDTGDSEGGVTETSDKRPEMAEAHGILPNFRGTITQVPPAFSAIKIGGERAYALARAGKNPEMPSRWVTIDRLELFEHGLDRSTLEADCSKGTYVRSLARDIAEALGTKGHIGALRRLRVGRFGLDAAISLSELENLPDPRSALLPVAAGLAQVPEIALDSRQAALVRLGNPVLLVGRDAPAFLDPAGAFCRGTLVAIGRIEQGQFKPKRLILND
ncbi:MAG: tRNA pseudouridine(55) synthase TruB [Cucumibacter sp.]